MAKRLKYGETDKTYIDERGYRRFKGGNNRLVHRWVAEKYIYNENPKDYKYSFSQYVVHHINKKKLDNSVENLEILTNNEHREIHGLEPELSWWDALSTETQWIIIGILIFFFIIILAANA